MKVQQHRQLHPLNQNGGVNIERVASHAPPKAPLQLIKEPKVVIEVESWWQRSGSGQSYAVTSPQSAPVTDQGPYEFRKILKPTSRNTNRSDGSGGSGSGGSGGGGNDRVQADSPDLGPFDFRKLLRRTDHAPTDTLKRCKGMSTTGSPSHV